MRPTPRPMPSSLRASRKPLLLALPLMLSLMGCSLTPTVATRYIDTSCQSFTIIHYSKDDTGETQTQVRAHNRAWHALCDAVTP